MTYDFETFNKWYEPFIKKYGGYKPIFIEKWFSRCTERHSSLANKIGSSLIQRYYTLTSSQKNADIKDAEPIIDEILKLIPNYLSTYAYTKEMFLSPTVPIGTHKVIKLSKHIRGYILDVLSHQEKINDVDALLIKIEKLLSKLGGIWSQSKTSDIDLEITLSTTPRAFASLGHYGPDVDSCFRQNGSSERDKYILAQSQNTFVITIAQKIEDGSYKNVARCFGYSSNTFDHFNIMNYYFRPKFKEGDALAVIKRLFEEISDTKMKMVQDRADFGAYIFRNSYGNFTFYSDPEKLYECRPALIDINLIKDFRCEKCGAREAERNLIIIDDIIVCSTCMKNANVCEISNKFTFKDLVSLVNDKEDEIFVCQEIAAKSSKCTKCERLHQGDGQCSICRSEIILCDWCNEQVHIDDTVIVIDEDICLKCADIAIITQDIR